jgi:hypothetical protein
LCSIISGRFCRAFGNGFAEAAWKFVFEIVATKPGVEGTPLMVSMKRMNRSRERCASEFCIDGDFRLAHLQASACVPHAQQIKTSGGKLDAPSDQARTELPR